MFKSIYVWFVSLIINFFNMFKKRPLSAPMEEVNHNHLKLDLQFFAEDDDDEEDDEGSDGDEDDDEDDVPNLDELLKDPKFKKQYNARFKGQLSKRMKKFEGIDPEEFRRLKEQAGKKKQNQEDEDEELETLKSELTDKEKRLLRAERREKRAIVKEYAVDNDVNPKLLARLINVDDIELNEDGEPENLDDLFEELEEEFPEYFGASDDDEEEDEPVKKKRKSTFVPGARQKSNKKKKVDPYEAGKLKALERHKKEEK
ncbi:hypothetical protein M3638_01350 [Oceanobacillus profundus]|uniref:hypothetical protein n=1 Tax=Oceanobacillus profundus TaxID=372463 RepID=UPI00203EB1E4|nr:hypothetical protein [Oceanobacillus profundus]MCM3396480.1 hypothetical protein [Oceanobacillus profundus]